MAHQIAFASDAPTASVDADAVLVVGRARNLLSAETVAAVAPWVDAATWTAMVKGGDATWDGRVATTWRATAPVNVMAGVLPEASSRGHGPSRAWAVGPLVEPLARRRACAILFADDNDVLAPQVLSAARAFPTWRAGTTTGKATFAAIRGRITDGARRGVQAVREAAALTDRPPNDLGVDAFVAEAEAAAARSGLTLTVIRGETALRNAKLGGLAAVGQAAEQPPALVVLERIPENPARRLAFVGKGIVYDTGGLSIKGKTAMPGMKMDMAGAAAVLAATEAIADRVPDLALTSVLCLAENAVGPGALRPDDIIRMRSGRSVEINNTDAEGRLVLADGLAWLATERPHADLTVDVATLTGAQMSAIGKRVGGVYAPHEEAEKAILAASRRSGEPFHPFPVFPEFHRKEFRSPVADLRNSVADRDNAQSACAAWFLHDALDAVGFDSPWAHLDICGPALSGRGRANGFGVGILMDLAGALD